LKIRTTFILERCVKNKMQNVKFEDWQKLDLRVGEILEIEEIENKDKLYKLKVNIGEEITIVAGIKQYYSKEELKNKKIIVIKNLEPVKLAGILSQGMLLAASSKEENKCVLLTIAKDIPASTKIS
jgi:methionine--tRNA ligase beta chain